MAPTSRTAFRLDSDLLDRVDKRAKAEGMSRTDFVVASLEAALADVRRSPVTRHPAKSSLKGKTKPADCAHPVSRRIKGTDLCGACGGKAK